MQISYILIDDHPALRAGIKAYFEPYSSFQLLGEFSSVKASIHSNLLRQPNFCLLDINLQEGNAITALPGLKATFPGCKFIAYTQFKGISNELDRAGFDGYLSKETALNDALTIIQYILDGNRHFEDESLFSREGKKMGFVGLNRYGVTKAELEVMSWVVKGLTSKQIAIKLCKSIQTVNTQRKNFGQKTNKKNILEISRFLEELN